MFLTKYASPLTREAAVRIACKRMISKAQSLVALERIEQIGTGRRDDGPF
jgi:hypothetical protein